MDDRANFARGNRTRKARLGFYIHLAAFLVVNCLLAYINFAASPGRLWCHWPLLGWGVGLLAHAVAVFVLPRMRSTRGARP